MICFWFLFCLLPGCRSWWMIGRLILKDNSSLWKFNREENIVEFVWLIINKNSTGIHEVLHYMWCLFVNYIRMCIVAKVWCDMYCKYIVTICVKYPWYLFLQNATLRPIQLGKDEKSWHRPPFESSFCPL